MIPMDITSKLVNDHEAFTEGDPDHFRDMPECEQEKALAWIKTNIFPGKRVWEGRDSYGLKHDFEHNSRIYMTNNQFKEAMLLCGFKPVDDTEQNWCYRIDRKSPIFIWHKCLGNGLDRYRAHKRYDRAMRKINERRNLNA